MLVLTRKKNEAVVIPGPVQLPAGQTIRVIVVEIRGDKVRLGFEAGNKEVPHIHREEVWKAIQKESEAHQLSTEQPPTT